MSETPTTMPLSPLGFAALDQMRKRWGAELDALTVVISQNDGVNLSDGWRLDQMTNQWVKQ